jgi:hypothetical protein
MNTPPVSGGYVRIGEHAGHLIATIASQLRQGASCA